MYIIYTLFTDILFIKSNRKTFNDFFKTPKSGHDKVCKEAMHNMWYCVFLFCDVLNRHGNLQILS